MISAEGLVKDFAGRRALDDVTFAVEPGEVVGLLGPNGAGKTTAIRLLLGLLRPDSGTAAVDGRVGYLPELHEAEDALTARGYLRFLGVAKGIDRRRLPEEIERVLAAADATDLARRPLGRLSKGQRQRVGLAQALLGAPGTYVLDEPTSGLDPAQVVGVRHLVRSLADEGAAVLVSTHLLAEAAVMCDRLLVLVRGRLVASEVPEPGVDLEARFLRLVAEAELS